jgi:hypothetical protein
MPVLAVGHRARSVALVSGVLLLVTVTAACLSSGAGRVRLKPGAERVDIVRDPARVEECVPIRDVRVSDGIIRRQRNRTHEGFRERAHARLRNVAARRGGDTVLITRESSRVIPDPPTFKWTIDAVVFQCSKAPVEE